MVAEAACGWVSLRPVEGLTGQHTGEVQLVMATQVRLLDLASGGVRQAPHEDDVFGHLEPAEVLPAVIEDLLHRALPPRSEDGYGDDRLAPMWVWHSDHRDVGNCRVG